MISEKAKSIKPSATLAVNAKVQELKKQGIDVIAFGIGEPDFDTPSNIKEAAKKAIDSGFTKYTPDAGIPELREAICAKFARDNNLHYAKENVVACNGAKQVLYNSMLALLNAHDEIIIASPYWLSYQEMAGLCGANAKIIATDEKFKLRADAVEEAITKSTKAIILNSPCNPSGAIIDESELKKIADIAVEHNLYVISDEVYEKFIYDGKEHKSIASFNDEIRKVTITINAISKTYAMTGWRIGYCACEIEIAKALANIQGQTTSAPNSIAQKAAVAALIENQDSVAHMVDEFDKRRKTIVKMLNEIQGINCNMPEGAFYAFPDASGTFNEKIRSANDFALFLLEKANVAVVPGEAFGSDKHVRFSYASSMQDIERGMERVARAVKELK
ncbi:MAG: pyridoxal phosphate-dependent aminotransferase [Candidatus Diapherotrites archaeon]|uniref:Pyridoxal phosphate-dependent aminotransferase n=1 Tax=Candidatus Iainarchaeum sp. TaxID=3101447 RepID=A0A8T4KW10_9ARCH|nr:pyridoxal phosphate-dependent aminotransferase [Candidatus Diapherotrites archaeon]